MEILLKFAQEWGLPLALVIFYIWRDYKRELFLSKRVKDLEEYQKSHYSEVVENNTQAMRVNSMVLQDLKKELKTKPCLLDLENSNG